MWTWRKVYFTCYSLVCSCSIDSEWVKSARLLCADSNLFRRVPRFGKLSQAVHVAVANFYTKLPRGLKKLCTFQTLPLSRMTNRSNENKSSEPLKLPRAQLILKREALNNNTRERRGSAESKKKDFERTRVIVLWKMGFWLIKVKPLDGEFSSILNDRRVNL